MSEPIASAGTRHVAQIGEVNRHLMEKALYMRCVSYLAGVKGRLLTETIFEFDRSKRRIQETSSELARQKQLIETHNLTLAERNRQLEEARALLEQRNRALAEADRMKSVFLASMSHELRTPLNSIIGFTELLLGEAGGPLGTEQKKQLGIIKTSSKHLLALINDLLDIAKIEAGKLELTPEDVRLDALIREVLDTLATPARAKRLDLRADPLPAQQIRTDRQRLKQILLNLLSNAVKFTERGSITLRALTEAHGGVCIEVRDTGIGIKPEHIPQLFEAFTQLDVPTTKPHQGAGLGLHLSQRLAHLLGGVIEVESQYGQGSVFRLHLPADCGAQRHETDTRGRGQRQ